MRGPQVGRIVLRRIVRVHDGDDGGEGLIAWRSMIGSKGDMVRGVVVFCRNLDGEGELQKIVNARHDITPFSNGQ